jgi:quinol monooxygenase YgiN
MIVLRFKVHCQAGKREQALAAFERVIGPSREVEGVISFDIGQELTDPDAIFGVEVFEDREALDRQEAQQVVQETIAQFGELVTEEIEVTIFHVSSSEPWGG